MVEESEEGNLEKVLEGIYCATCDDKRDFIFEYDVKIPPTHPSILEPQIVHLYSCCYCATLYPLDLLVKVKE